MRSRYTAHPRGLILLSALLCSLCSLSLSACDDEREPTVGGVEGAAQAGAEPPLGASVVEPPLGATEAGVMAGLMAGTTPSACDTNRPCEGELTCFQGRCVEESPCVEGVCEEGYLCVGGLCFEDPDAPPPSGEQLAFNPDRMRFVFQAENTPTEQLTQLINISDAPIFLSELRLEGSGTFRVLNAPQLPLRLSPQEPLQLSIQHTADDQGADVGTLTATTLEGSSATLQVVAETKSAAPAAPCLTVSPAQLFFGSVGRGQQVSLDVTLSPCGEQPVRVSAINRGVNLFGALPATFSFTPPQLPLELMPGQQVSFPVTYAPRRAGLEGGFIEVVSDDVSNPRQNVNLSAIAEPPALEDVGLHVKLDWDTDLTDVDLHLIAPNGQVWTCAGDCYFSNGNPNWADQSTDLDDPFLDRDDVDGFGPENINLESPAPGTYKVWVHYYDAHDGQDPSATIELYSFGALMGSFGPQPLNQIDEIWEVAEVDFPGFVVRPVNVVTRQARGPMCGGF